LIARLQYAAIIFYLIQRRVWENGFLLEVVLGSTTSTLIFLKKKNSYNYTSL